MSDFQDNRTKPKKATIAPESKEMVVLPINGYQLDQKGISNHSDKVNSSLYPIAIPYFPSIKFGS